MDLRSLYSKSTATMKSSMIREMLAQTKGVPGMISFAGGFPSPATFPTKVLAELTSEVIRESGADILQYGASEGDTMLKEAIIDWEATNSPLEKGAEGGAGNNSSIALTQNQLLICNGATNGIYYFTKAFINQDDVILCEGPTFLGSVVSFEAVGAKVISVDMDNDGIMIDKLSAVIKDLKSKNKTIKFLYTIPDFQNPTGITMSLQRRHDLIKLMQAENILILEDDPYRELRYTGERIPSLFEIARKEYNDTKLVTVIKSYSKILGPGLRLAAAIGHEDIIKPMCSWLQKVIVNPDGVAQRAVAKYIKKGYLKDHIDSICKYYQPYQEAITQALTKYMPKGVNFTKPEGGIFVWLNTEKNINFDEIFKEVITQKVCYIPGSKFYPEGFEKHNCLRLNFSYPTIEQINNGVEILANVIKNKL